jgi:hypothetical protein
MAFFHGFDSRRQDASITQETRSPKAVLERQSREAGPRQCPGNRRLLDELKLAYAGNRWEVPTEGSSSRQVCGLRKISGIVAVIDFVPKLDGWLMLDLFV